MPQAKRALQTEIDGSPEVKVHQSLQVELATLLASVEIRADGPMLSLFLFRLLSSHPYWLVIALFPSLLRQVLALKFPN